MKMRTLRTRLTGTFSKPTTRELRAIVRALGGVDAVAAMVEADLIHVARCAARGTMPWIDEAGWSPERQQLGILVLDSDLAERPVRDRVDLGACPSWVRPFPFAASPKRA